MAESKLISILKQFDEQELERLSLFIKSEYFAVSNQVAIVLTHLIKQAKNWQEEEVSDERIFRLVYRDMPFKPSKVHYLRSDVLKIVDKFLVHEGVDEQKLPFSLVKSAFYQRKGLEKIYADVLEDIHKQNQVTPQLSNYYYYYEGILHERRLASHSFKQDYSRPIEFTEWEQTIEIGYVIQQLEIYSLSLIQNCLYNHKQIQEESCRKFMQDINEKAYLVTIPAIQIYLAILEMYLSITEHRYWWDYKAKLNSLKKQANAYDIYNFYTKAFSYCNLQVRNGFHSFQQEIFEIYQTLVDEKYIFVISPYIHESTFRNYLSVCLQLGYLDKAKQILAEQEKGLRKYGQMDLFHFSRAMIAFEERDFKEVVANLSKVNPQDLFFEDNVRVLYIQTYTELKEWESVESNLNAYRVNVSRNKQHTKEYIQFRLNFARYINILRNIDEKGWENAKINHTIKELKETNPVFKKTWILKKLQDQLK